MKTFKEYGGDTVDPHYHAYGGSLLGPSLGQYRPVADLNANKHGNSKGQLLGPKKPRTNEKEVTKFFSASKSSLLFAILFARKFTKNLMIYHNLLNVNHGKCL